MLAVGRVLTLTRTKYGPQAHVHWYCATGGIPVDLHTLAVSIVSKKHLSKLKSVEGSKVQSVGSSVGRGGILGSGSWCFSCPGCWDQVPRIN